MKIYFAYILFLVFAFKPIYNLGYFVYYELNIDYIIETYCVNKEKPKMQCNGKCHLAEQLALNTPDNESDKESMSIFSRAFSPMFFQEYSNVFKPYSEDVLVYNNWTYFNNFISLCNKKLDRPPQV